jgi:hypothetical protein
VGVAFAEVDGMIRGRAMLLFLSFARGGKALVSHLPRLVLARLTKNEQEILEQQCYLWRATSYARKTLQLFAPRLFPQRHFFEGLKFRGERTALGTKPKPV